MIHSQRRHQEGTLTTGALIQVIYYTNPKSRSCYEHTFSTPDHICRDLILLWQNYLLFISVFHLDECIHAYIGSVFIIGIIVGRGVETLCTKKKAVKKATEYLPCGLKGGWRLFCENTIN